MLSNKMLASILKEEASSGTNWSSYNATNDKSPITFSTNNGVFYITLVPIDNSRVLIVYRAASNYCYGRIASIDSNGDVTFGSEVELLSQQVGGIDAKLIDSTHALIACDVLGIKCFIVTFSGTTISAVGSTTLFADGVNLDPHRFTLISSSEFLVGYEDITNSDTVVHYGSFSGTTVTAGNSLTITSDDTSRFTIEKIREGKAVVFYNDETNSRLDAQLVSVSGTTPQSDDTIIDIPGNSDDTAVQSAIYLEEGKLFLTFEDLATVPNNIKAVIISESSGTLSQGTIEVVYGGNPEFINVTLPDSSHAVISYGLGTTGGISTSVVEISGATLNALSSYSNVSGDKEEVTNAAVGSDFVVLAYHDDDDSSHGKLIVMRA